MNHTNAFNRKKLPFSPLKNEPEFIFDRMHLGNIKYYKLNLGEYCCRQWLVAHQYQAITWTKLDVINNKSLHVYTSLQNWRQIPQEPANKLPRDHWFTAVSSLLMKWRYHIFVIGNRGMIRFFLIRVLTQINYVSNPNHRLQYTAKLCHPHLM